MLATETVDFLCIGPANSGNVRTGCPHRSRVRSGDVAAPNQSDGNIHGMSIMGSSSFAATMQSGV
jgi:hypothetical protein